MQVEPALACDQIADLDEPEQAVIVGSPGKVFEAARRSDGGDDKHRQQCLDHVAAPELPPAEPRSGYCQFARHSRYSPLFKEEFRQR